MAGRQWIRVDSKYLTNPKVRRAGPAAMALHLASICYCAEHDIDDGLLPPEALAVVAINGWVEPHELDDVVGRLVTAGLWEASMQGGFIVHDYAVMNGASNAAYRHKLRQQAYRRRLRLIADDG